MVVVLIDTVEVMVVLSSCLSATTVIVVVDTLEDL